MSSEPTVTRRGALAGMAGVAAASLIAPQAHGQDEAPAAPSGGGRLKQSVCRWCYGKLSLEELATIAKNAGLVSVELLNPDEWPVVQGMGLTCAMANGPGGIEVGWNATKNHDRLMKKAEELLPQVAQAGLPNMIVFSGNRRGMDDMEGLKNCAEGLKRLIPLAEQLGVTLCMELLNSKRDHKDYMCDHTAWGVALAQEIGSDRFKLLYDIYHMQIMEGDVIQTLLENLPYIGHLHTGGVPGRHEIDETQELNYRRICEAVVDAGYTGYLGQEFIPANDPATSLAQAFAICNV